MIGFGSRNQQNLNALMIAGLVVAVVGYAVWLIGKAAYLWLASWF